jgi:hypothetical protein
MKTKIYLPLKKYTSIFPIMEVKETKLEYGDVFNGKYENNEIAIIPFPINFLTYFI